MMIMPSDAELPNNPRIGWRNLITLDNVTASDEADGFPVANLANPATNLRWKASASSGATITIALDAAADADYLGIARHNLGTAGITYTLQSSSNGTDWTAVTGASDTPSDDRVVFHQFASVNARYWRLSLSSGSAEPLIAVLYLGEITVLERRIYVGHTPITLGRRRQVSTGRSESGQFLGRIRRSSLLESRISMQNLDPDWYREELDGFVEDGDLEPFFWAWRPDDYPAEVAFCWAMDDIVPTNQRSNGMMQVEASIQGIP